MAYNPGGSRSYGGGGYRGGGGGRSYGGGGGGGGGRGGPRRGPMEMHQATCADCGKSCEVPFRPSGNKPVFCSNCFKSKDGGGDRPDRGGRDFERRDSGGGGGRRSYGDRDYSDRPPMEMHQAICTDCGRDCEVPFKPTGDKPIFCDKCFGKNKEIKMGKPPGGNAGNSPDLSAKFDMLNIKLDRILKALDVVAAGKIMAQEKPQNKPAPAKAPIAAEKASPEKAPAKKIAKVEEKSVIKKVKSGKSKGVKAAKK